jgi:hypothetical protein
MQNYSFTQKIFHDLVLGRKFINKSLFELEKITYLKNKDTTSKKHIFITGLPRSGTTVLLNFIYSSLEFASLKYSNMPFIFSPNFSKLFNKKNIQSKERLHYDGIYYDLNSPEAFDEIFFNQSDKYVKDELLNYINLILISDNRDKYLSKNNLNYKRINFIKSILPNSNFLIPIRDPLHHANSLLKQHIHFSKLQKNDDFIKRYMNYLGHHEFGLNQKPWNNPIEFNDPNDINYWIEQWYLFYQHIFDKYKDDNNCFFIIYEELSKSLYVEKLIKKLRLEKNTILNSNFFKNSNKKIDINLDNNTYKKSIDIYNIFLKHEN